MKVSRIELDRNGLVFDASRNKCILWPVMPRCVERSYFPVGRLDASLFTGCGIGLSKVP